MEKLLVGCGQFHFSAIVHHVNNNNPRRMASSSSSSYSSNSPCAACKFLRRKCMPGCIFAPYFPPEDPQKFTNVHKIFGASNVTKLLNEVLPHQREDTVNSLAYEAEARMKDPVYGCVGAISVLQSQLHRLQKELDAANSDLLQYATAATNTSNDVVIPTPLPALPPAMVPNLESQFDRRRGGGGGGSTFYYPYAPPWNAGSNNTSRGDDNCGGDDEGRSMCD